MKKLIEVAANHPRQKYVIGILLLTGMRIGEMLALKWSDIDVEGKTIYVKGSVSKKYAEENGIVRCNGAQVTATKTLCSVREIPVNQLVIDLILEWEYLLCKNHPKIKNHRKVNKTDDIIFVNYHGKLMSYGTIYDELMALLRKNNLTHCGVLFHKLRHCYATHMVDAGVDINVVSKLLGHSYIDTTSKFYVKVNKEPKIVAVKRHEQHLTVMLDFARTAQLGR